MLQSVESFFIVQNAKGKFGFPGGPIHHSPQQQLYMLPFLYGFLTAGLMFGAIVWWYFNRALKRVRTMQRYMKDDAAKIVHAAAKDIYGKKP